MCAGCAHYYEQRATNCGCSVCGLHLAAGVDIAPGVEAMCPSCTVQHAERAARSAVSAAVERAEGEAPLRARVAELEAAAANAARPAVAVRRAVAGD